MTTADFRPTHVVPQDGLPAWEAPDVNRPTAPLDALLPVQLVDRLGDWARIVCANDWSAWVDGRLLIAVPADPPAAGHPLTRTADPAPLLARTEEALSRYRHAAGQLASGDTDAESFRGRTRGLRAGVIVDGESIWLYDAEHERWVYCDGTRLSTYATTGPPSVQGLAGAPDPTQPAPETTSSDPQAEDATTPKHREPPASAGGPAPDGAGGPEPTQAIPETSPPDPQAGDGATPTRGAPAASAGGLAPDGAGGPEPRQAAPVTSPSELQSMNGDTPTHREPPASAGGLAPDGAGGPQPTQVVAPATSPSGAQVADGDALTRRESAASAGRLIPGGTGDPEPTQAADPATNSSEPHAASIHRESPTNAGSPVPDGIGGPEATQVVVTGASSSEPQDGGTPTHRAPPASAGRLVPDGAGGPQPTQVVESVPDPGDVCREGPAQNPVAQSEGLGPDSSAGAPTRRIPPITVDRGGDG